MGSSALSGFVRRLDPFLLFWVLGHGDLAGSRKEMERWRNKESQSWKYATFCQGKKWSIDGHFEDQLNTLNCVVGEYLPNLVTTRCHAYLS
jgi:hypothetical protein